jgi:hypothetical protein
MPDGRLLFSDVAFLAGVAKTDWSWAPLFADFDNDGWKDIFIGNGYRKDVTNLDFIFFSMEGSPFGTPEARRKKYLAELERLEPVQTSNRIYRNTGTLIFEDKTDDWGIQLPTYSNGAAYTDFDNDGDLDLVTNNIDQEVILYENGLNTRKEKNHFIRLVPKDHGSLNEKINVYTQGRCQYQDRTPFRGFQSTVASYAHFGVGQSTMIDSVIVEWQDHTVAKYSSIKSDTILAFSKSDSSKVPAPREEAPVFQKFDLAVFRHHETSPPDLNVTRTLLHDLTRSGPCLASGDVNGDHLDDFFVGGEVGNASRIFMQQPGGTFRSTRFTPDSTREDGGALFFDADQDGDLDLYVAGACPSAREPAAVHQLFLNNGKGSFSPSSALPEIITSGSCVEPADYDGDGDLDLFVGGRLKPDFYPNPPRSYVLRNDHGKFTDVTTRLNPALETPGLVSSAVWTDVDNDKKPDLIIAGEWMPIRIFKNEGEKFTEITDRVGLENTNGWWNCLKAADLNNDGYVEIIAGNTGKNSYFQPTLKEPVQIIANDFDKNGSIDPIITYYNPVEQDRFIVHNRLVLTDQIPSMKRRFETFTQYATTPFRKAFNKAELEGIYVGNAYELASVILVNKEGKKFEIVELPEIAQVYTINDFVVEDVNRDGFADIIAIGNTYCQETLFGRYDASLGTILLGNGNLTWKEWPPNKSGLVIDGDARHILTLETSGGQVIVIGNNDDWLTFYARRVLSP